MKTRKINAKRDQAIVRALAEPTNTLAKIGAANGVTATSVLKIGRKLCPETMAERAARSGRAAVAGDKRGRPAKTERNTQLVEALKGRDSLLAIAESFNLSKPRVHQLGHALCPEVMIERAGRGLED